MNQPMPLSKVLMFWLILMGWLMPQAGSAQPTGPAVRTANAALKRALNELVAMPGGPPGAIALVQRGGSLIVHAAGTRALGSPERPHPQDAMRVASIAKAFNAATALPRWLWLMPVCCDSTTALASGYRTSRPPGRRSLSANC